VVFEDAQSGVEAARAGNFFCVGIDRHQNAAALRAANVVVKDLSEISVEDLIKMTGGN
jgi:beta-phosphoglucomutase-like phosphatase (HAD superfamily)